MRLDLQNIDDEGKDFSFDELSDELKGHFRDLIGHEAFKIQMQVRLLGNSYQVLGQLQSQYKDVCSQCGEDITVPLKNRINEILVIEKKRPRNTQVSQSQQNFDSEGPSVIYLNEPTLEVGEFLHELMAASLVAFPSCSDQKACAQRRQTHLEPYLAQKTLGHPGFAALKDIKLKH
jgi:uncharacterized metal-binding protein YceD (DUF177 family)